MTKNPHQTIEKLEADLWEAADNLRVMYGEPVDLNKAAAKLAAKMQEHFEELGICRNCCTATMLRCWPKLRSAFVPPSMPL